MQLLKNPIFHYHHFAFTKLLAFRLQIVLAYQIMAVVVGWHIYELTHDALSLGLIGLAEVIPYMCSALFAGYLVDHYSRRLFGLMAAAMLGINALTLALVSAGYLDGGTLVWIYGSIAFNGVARAFLAPTYSTLFAVILPRDDYAKASGIGSAVFQTGLVLGPAIGGLLVGYASKTTAYIVATLLCMSAASVLLSLNIKQPPSAKGAPIFTSIAQGLRFVFSNQIMLGAQALDMFAVLFGGAVSLLPVFISEIYRTGPEALGILRAAPALGAIITGVYLAKFPIKQQAGRWLLISVASFGLCIIGFALNPYFWLGFFLLLLSGIFDGVSVVIRTTIMQLATPDAMRGRVSAINGIFIGSSNELGAFESGVAAKLMGLIPSVIFGGMMTLGIVGATAKLAPKLSRLDLKKLEASA